MSLVGTIMGNFWFAKEEISDNLFPQKSKEKREKIKQSEGYKKAMRFFDLIGTKDINYLTALGEDFDSAYICADIADKSRKAGIPLTQSAVTDIVKVTGYTEDQIIDAIRNKTLVEFLKGKGISEESAKNIGIISRELYDGTSNKVKDFKTVAEKLSVSENEVNFVSGLLNEYNTVYRSTIKPFMVGVESDGQSTPPQQPKQSKRNNNKRNAAAAATTEETQQ